jgi:Glycosyl hydrolases family 2, TIM barrel domain
MQVNYVKAMYHLTKSLDPTRPVIGNDGWESSITDIIGIHDYDADASRLEKRYEAHDVLQGLFQRERPGGRLLVIDEEHHHADLPIVLSEFGGISLGAMGMVQSSDPWGYSRVDTADAFASRYTEILRAVGSAGLLAGFCYTQFADAFQEANGLLNVDRTPKIPLAVICAATKNQQPGEPSHPLGAPILRVNGALPV